MLKGNCVVFALTLIASTRSQHEGDGCVKNGVAGTCRLLSNCESSVRDLKNRVMPQTCSFLEMEAVVCCADTPNAVTATPATPSILTTTKRTTTTTEYVPQVFDYKFNDADEAGGTCEPVSALLTSPRSGQIAWDKCIEYQEKLVYPCVKVNSLAGGKGEQRARVSRCGHDTDELIVGGINASKLEFPHMTLLGFGEELESTQWLCGGSIISERYILTAAHCTYSLNAGRVTYALVGILSRTEQVDSSQRYRIEKSIRHPEYKPPQKYNDIALLKTETEIIMSASVVPGCLHVDTTAPVQRALATGWGATRNKGSSADILQKVVLKKFTDAECGRKYRRSRFLAIGFDPNTQICYGDKENSKDTCQGDSGGPLQLKSQRIHCMYTVVGVTSFGRACGVVAMPGIYTRVAAYVPWIESIVWPSTGAN